MCCRGRCCCCCCRTRTVPYFVAAFQIILNMGLLVIAVFKFIEINEIRLRALEYPGDREINLPFVPIPLVTLSFITLCTSLLGICMGLNLVSGLSGENVRRLEIWMGATVVCGLLGAIGLVVSYFETLPPGGTVLVVVPFFEFALEVPDVDSVFIGLSPVLLLSVVGIVIVSAHRQRLVLKLKQDY